MKNNTTLNEGERGISSFLPFLVFGIISKTKIEISFKIFHFILYGQILKVNFV